MVQVREKTTVFVCLLLLGCSGAGSASLPPLAPTPKAETKATLAGPLCEFDHCKCREDADDPEQEAPEGFKRYEVRIGPSDNELWVTLGDMVFYKSNEHASDCFYIDLRPGRHPVRVRAHRQDGFAARVKISERAPSNQGWYDTFDFACGSPGVCSRDVLRDWKAEISTYEKNAHDPCGSTKIRGVVWQTGREPDSVPPADLQLDFILDVYKFTPTFGPGAAECARAK